VPWLLPVPPLVEPVGLLFINAIRMTVIPLVVASLIVGVASAGDASTIGRLGGRSVLLFLVLVLFSCVFAAAIAYPLLAYVTIDPAVAASLRSGAEASGRAAAASARQLPGVAQWIVDLVPVNVFKAASDGSMLPLIVFSVGFGVALTRVAGEARQAVLSVLRGIADAMIWLVGWVLTFAPIGVFALAVPLAARMGLAAAGALASYILLLSAIAGAFVLVIYPIAIVFGRVSPGAFVRAAAPAQAVAFTSRASLAALPASFEGAKQLGLSESFSAFFLPLAASMFRVGGAIAQVVGVLFLARLYDVALAPMQVVTVVIVGTLTSFTIPGIPAGAIIVMAPVLVSVGVPAEGIGILVGVDTIPDMFRTTANVTAWIGGAAILGGRGNGNSEFTIQNADGSPRNEEL
ncbi:MAG: dicarboxylate/amino acid:cation symporter, partial [Bacteroidales bacterium]